MTKICNMINVNRFKIEMLELHKYLISRKLTTVEMDTLLHSMIHHNQFKISMMNDVKLKEFASDDEGKNPLAG